jgi:diguanylate cyclase (GGDEF)-like protein
MTLRAREPRTAARSAALILMVCAVAFGGLTIAQESAASPGVDGISWAVVALLVAAALSFRLLPAELLDRGGALAVAPLAGVLLVCCLNVLTRDGSTAAQAFLAFPVLWGASHLRPGPGVVVTAAALLGDGVSLFLVRPAAAAATDFAFFGAVLVVMAVLLIRAGTTQERLVAALQHQAQVDSLTGLVNRRVFDETLEASVQGPAATSGTALVLIDVDSFKSVNDSHGHPVGDDVLVHLAELLSQEVRGTDALLSRLGGDELALLLTPCTAEAAVQRADQLLVAVQSSPLALPDGTLLSLSISVGVAHLPRNSGDIRALYSAADAALYEAKRAGRGRVVVASP